MAEAVEAPPKPDWRNPDFRACSRALSKFPDDYNPEDGLWLSREEFLAVRTLIIQRMVREFAKESEQIRYQVSES